MLASKRLKQFAIATIIASSTGCQTGVGLSTLSLNPFGSPNSAETSEKIAVTESTESKSGEGRVARMGDMVRSAGSATRNMFTSAFSFGRNDESPVVADQPQDVLSLSKTPDQLGPEVYVANGQLWESSGSFERAMENYDKALETDPNNAPALGAIARLNDRQNNLDESIKYFQLAIKADPNDPKLYNDYGMVLARKSEHTESLEQIQKAIAIAPTNKRFANNMATVYMQAGQHDKALATLTNAHPPAVAQYNMAYLQFKQQKFVEARTHLESALAMDPKLEPARNLLDKIGGSQIANVTKDTIASTTSAGQKFQDISQTVQSTYQTISGATGTPPADATTSTVSSGLDSTTPAAHVAALTQQTSASSPPSLQSTPTPATTDSQSVEPPIPGWSIPPTIVK